MIVMIQQEQPRMPISVVLSNTYTHGGCMITVGKIPQKVKLFFQADPNLGFGSRVCLLLLAGCRPSASAVAVR